MGKIVHRGFYICRQRLTWCQYIRGFLYENWCQLPLMKLTVSDSSYSREFDLRLNRMVCVSIDGAQHCPIDTTSRSTAVEERWRSRVDSQIPGWELYFLVFICI